MIFKKLNIKWINKCQNTYYTSISLWKKYILANKINSNSIKIFNSENGEYLYDILDKDNGIFEIKNADYILILNDILFRIDNFLGICQVYNLNLNNIISVFIFKDLKLIKSLCEYYDNKYIIYALDNNNNIIKYEIDILDNYIKNIKKYNFLSLPKINISDILIDLKFSRILISDNVKSKLFILDLKGNIKKSINIEISKIIIHKNYYICTDNEIDTNMIHLIFRKNLKYEMSYMSEKIKNISFMESIDDDIYILDNDCTLAKISLNNNNNLFLLTLGFFVSVLILK